VVAPKGVIEEDREEVKEEDTHACAPPLPLFAGVPEQQPPPEDPPSEELPAWSATAFREAKRSKKSPYTGTRAGLVNAVAECLEAITGKPSTSAASAKAVISLWKSLDYPPLRGFVADLKLIAEAAQHCPHGLFAKDIRGEGWSDGSGVNRSRDPETICRHGRWDARLGAAAEWRTRPAEPRETRTDPDRSEGGHEWQALTL